MTVPEHPDSGPLAFEVLEELRTLDSDGSMLPGLVSTFRRDATAKLAELRAVVRLGQPLEVGRLAHSLCGAARTLGARHLASAAKELQLASRLSDAQEDERLLGVVARDLAVALEALDRFLSR